MISRRDFLCAGMATLGTQALPLGAVADGSPNLRLGVISDIHISRLWKQEIYLEKALRWLDSQSVDAVIVPGDIAHSGLISEFERFAAIWFKVFPEDHGADGRHVERLFVTGNHDIDAWWDPKDVEGRRKKAFHCGDNAKKVWERLFHEDWQLIWSKEVKGYRFVGAQWSSLKPPLEEYFNQNAAMFDAKRPFFFIQHEHPSKTCHGRHNGVYVDSDRGESVRALNPFPMAVAITGHTHFPLTDDAMVWQGRFTSIGAGCLREGSVDSAHGYDSTHAFWDKRRFGDRMKPLAYEEGRCGLLLDVYDDKLIVHRQSFEYDCPLESDLSVPLPAVVGGEFDHGRRKSCRSAPQFAPDAVVKAVVCAVAPTEVAGPGLQGKPCVHVSFPCAQTVRECRVFDYVVTMRTDGKPPIVRTVLAPGFHVPERYAKRDGHCLFGIDELPTGTELRFEVVPRDCYGVAGKGLVSQGVRL